jgi:hypothetical protein
MKTYGSYQEIIAEVKHERDKCKRECYSRDFQLIRSRGTSLLQMGENGRVYDEAWFTRSSNPTLRELKEAAKSTLENGGFYVAVDGGFDGVYSIRDNEIEPFIGDWGVDISVDNVLAL